MMNRLSGQSTLREFFFYIGCLILIVICINLVNFTYLHKSVDAVSPIDQTYEPVKFILYSYADNSISARFWFYDVSGREIGSYERSWPGYALGLKIRHFSVANVYISIPLHILTMNKYGSVSSGGTKISPYFFKDGKTLLFSSDSTNLSQNFLEKITHICRFTADTAFVNMLFTIYKDSVVKTQYVNLEACEKGVMYTLRCSRGNAVIIR